MLIALYVVVPQFGSFYDSLKLWAAIRETWVLMAIGIFAGSYLAAAAVYYCLALRRLHYGRTVLVQFAAMFASHVLPAGAGALGVNYHYLRRARHSQVQAATIVSTNNALGLLGHGLLIGIVAVSGGFRRQHFVVTAPAHLIYWLLSLFVLLALLLCISSLRRRLARMVHQVVGVLGIYKRRPKRIIMAFLASILLTITYVLTLYNTAQALGFHVSLVTAFVILTIGVIGATATPTPGGLGGAEAGIVGGLVLTGYSSHDGLAVALLYRLITFWLPLTVGAAAFVVARKRLYI